MKIDIFAHILPVKYKEALQKENLPESYRRMHETPTLFDIDRRLQAMDKFDDLVQIPTIAGPPLENICDPQRAADLARLANDGLAELVLKHPDRFPAAVAWLPMNNMEAALAEADRAIKELHLKGVQIYTPINNKPLDSPEFVPLYEKMAQYDLPIWIHPSRPVDYPDYLTETSSQYGIQVVFGWVYETTTAMARLVMSGILEKYPNLKFITHHCGAMVPFLADRIEWFLSGGDNLKKPHLDYFKMFYNDTALCGNTAGLMCSHAFFGADHILLGTDVPFDRGQHGEKATRDTIESIERMAISEAEKKMIFEDNARKLLHLAG